MYERNRSVASHTPELGTEPEIQACALTGNQTLNLLVYGITLQPSHNGQSYLFFIVLAQFVIAYLFGRYLFPPLVYNIREGQNYICLLKRYFFTFKKNF